jgi:hypothetical protein
MSTISRSGVECALAKSSAHTWMEFGPGSFFLDHSSYDIKRARLSSRWLIVSVEKRKVYRFAYEQNVYSHDELAERLATLGMRVEHRWGSLGSAKRFRPDAWDLTLVARKTRHK